MSLIAYVHNNEDAQVIQRYFTENNILNDLDFNLIEAKKPQRIEIEHGLVILNDENPDTHHDSLHKSQEYDNLITRVERLPTKAISEITDRDTTIHLPELELSIHGVNEKNKNIIDEITKHSKGDILQLHKGGRPPLGCEVNSGYITKADNYREVRETLALHVEGSISKEEAAQRIDTTPRTIERARDRKQLYQLE